MGRGGCAVGRGLGVAGAGVAAGDALGAPLGFGDPDGSGELDGFGAKPQICQLKRP